MRETFDLAAGVAAEAAGAGSTQQAERKIAIDIFPSPLDFDIRTAPDLDFPSSNRALYFRNRAESTDFRCIRATLREATKEKHAYGQTAACLEQRT